MIEGEQFCEKFEIQSNHQKVVQSNKVKRSMIEKTLCKPPKIYAIKYLPFCNPLDGFLCLLGESHVKLTDIRAYVLYWPSLLLFLRFYLSKFFTFYFRLSFNFILISGSKISVLRKWRFKWKLSGD